MGCMVIILLQNISLSVGLRKWGNVFKYVSPVQFYSGLHKEFIYLLSESYTGMYLGFYGSYLLEDARPCFTKTKQNKKKTARCLATAIKM